MSKQLENDFKTCIDRVIESRYEEDKINCCIMDLKSKVLREMATNSDHAKCCQASKWFKDHNLNVIVCPVCGNTIA
ncbi:MAG: hypothetical protein PF569_09125 [Candidatus Woesearchaeota archaeon]|nr:hypothetical protein [Candidatus Woesearchaeota archaeon]